MVGLQLVLIRVVAMIMKNHLGSLIWKIYQYVNDLTMQSPKTNYFNFDYIRLQCSSLFLIVTEDIYFNAFLTEKRVPRTT